MQAGPVARFLKPEGCGRLPAMKIGKYYPNELLALLCLMLLGELLVAVLAPSPLAPAMQHYRVFHLLQMAALILLVVRGMELLRRASLLVVAGLLLSLMGDLINSFLVDLSHLLEPQVLLSIPAFVGAHLCYIAAFSSLLRERQGAGVQWRKLLPISLPLALLLWWLVIDAAAPPLLKALSVGYALVVTLMGLVAWQYARRLCGAAWIPAAGGLLFVVSDSLLGLFLLDGPARPLWASQAIWTSYFLAQALICALVIPGQARRGEHAGH